MVTRTLPGWSPGISRLDISTHIYTPIYAYLHPIYSYNLALVTVLGCILGLTMYLRARSRGQASRQAGYSTL